MNDKTQSFLAVLKALHQNEVEYILVGGLAVAFHGIARVTKDVDLFVKRTPENFVKLRKALMEVFGDEAIAEITHEELQQYPVLRYGTPEDYYIDVLDRIGEMFQYNDLEFEIIISQGVPVRVATMETLIRLKEGTLRPRDQMDVGYLMQKLQEKKHAGL